MKACTLVIGHAILDVLETGTGRTTALGGLFHAARTLWALEQEFVLGYLGPTYLDPEVHSHGKQLGAKAVVKLGNVTGSPNVVIVGEPTEAGDQRYEFVRQQNHSTDLDLSAWEALLSAHTFTDVLVFSGEFPLEQVLSLLNRTSARVHLDANFELPGFSIPEILGRKLQTLILSTSSHAFHQTFGACFQIAKDTAETVSTTFMLKENRGGTRYSEGATVLSIPAFPTKTAHSVGVGDCYDAAFLTLSRAQPSSVALRRASLIATAYCSTLSAEEFRTQARRVSDISNIEVESLSGTVVPWESRQSVHVYIAAPDFSHCDRSLIDEAFQALKYHNFCPHRPVLENGEVGTNSSQAIRASTAEKDLQLLQLAQVVVVIPIYEDAGTFIEMGIAVQQGKPVIVHIPNGVELNLLTEQLATAITRTVDELVSQVFQITSTLLHEP